MAKKILTTIKLQLQAGKANPAPPVGPALGQHGINIMGFCKEFNSKTQDKMGTVVPVVITVFEDRSFSFIMKTPPASFLILKEAGIKKGSSVPNAEKVGKISKEQVQKIAEIKMEDLNANDIQAAMKIIEGTAKNMGVEVVK